MSGWGRRVGALPIAGVTVTLMALIAMWEDNLRQLPVEGAIPTLAAAAAIAGVTVVAFRPLAGSWMRAGLFSGLFAIYLFYVPALLRALPLQNWALVAIYALITALIIFVGRRIPAEHNRLWTLNSRINLLCLILLVWTVAPVTVKLISLSQARSQATAALPDFDGHAAQGSPDVWHILLDRYASVETFESTYSYDNRPFVEQLRRRGFVVQDHAFGNYQRTGHSVASTMNGVLLDPLSDIMRDQPNDWVPIYRLMRNGAAIRFFGNQGYRTVFAGSWWEPTRFSNAADESMKIRAMPQLARMAISKSAIGLWTGGLSLPYLDGRSDQCFRANEKFRRLRLLAAESGRKYVFAHFLVPHPPFVLNSDGSCRSIRAAKAASRRDNYVAQVDFANREVLSLIDAIRAAKRPAVIVLHSDEGPWPAPYIGNEHGLGTDRVSVPWTELPPKSLREKMAILLAVRGPDGAPPTMPTSPVQIYPAILHDFFGSARPLPPSRHYIFESDDQLYRFREVSGKLAQR
jgi:hypothetical protein